MSMKEGDGEKIGGFELEKIVSNPEENELKVQEEEIFQGFFSLNFLSNSSSDSSGVYAGHPTAWQQASWLSWQQLGSRQLGRSGPR